MFVLAITLLIWKDTICSELVPHFHASIHMIVCVSHSGPRTVHEEGMTYPKVRPLLSTDLHGTKTTAWRLSVAVLPAW